MSSSSSFSHSIQAPLDLVRVSLDEIVYVKMKGDRELRGKLHAFDQHMNLVLGDVEETCPVPVSKQDQVALPVDATTSTNEAGATVMTRKRGMLFVRGDSVILMAPPTRLSRG